MKMSKKNFLNHLTLALLLAVSCVLPGFAIAGGLWRSGDVSSAPDILPVDQAFQLQPVERTDRGLKLGWIVSTGYYLYRERIKVEAAEPAAIKIAAPTLPAGEKHHDEHFGDVHISRGGSVDAEIPGAKSLGQVRKLKISYQGCSESGVCYPPQTRIVDVMTFSAAHP
jgi:thiol:disulfide interchange protein DsbD